MRARLGGRRAVRRIRIGHEQRSAVRRARRLVARSAPPVRVCWDLDNTLVASGVLLRRGMPLSEAVPAAEPVANMLRFCAALTDALPAAERVFVSARRASLRDHTAAWLARNEVIVDDDRLILVPHANAKVDVWRMLGRDAALVIIDDLCFGHETESIREYADLVAEARALAAVFVGSQEIGGIESGALAVDRAVRTVLEGVEAAAGAPPSPLTAASS